MIENKTHFSIQALQAGDREEFTRVMDTYSEMIYRLGLKMLRNPQDAEDVLQETFLKAYHHLEDFQGKSKISTWLYSIATNEALMRLREKNGKQVQVSLSETQERDDGQETARFQFVDWCCLPEKELMSTEAMEYLDRAVEQLSESNRIVFLLRDIEGLSTQEAAEVLEISEGAVKTRLSRARLRLREILSGYYGRKMSSEAFNQDRLGKDQFDGKKI